MYYEALYSAELDATIMFMETSSSTFGKNMQRRREDMLLTQPDLLERLKEYGVDVKQATLSHYETGRRFPDPPVMAAIARSLDVSVDYLLGLTENESPVAELLEELEKATGEGKINRIMRKLPKEKQSQIMSFAEFLLSEEKKIAEEGPLSEWIAATEVLTRRYGASGESSFAAFLAVERPDLAAALGIPAKKKSI